METISRGQLICIKTLVGKLKLKDSDALVSGFSNFRTTHVSELMSNEAASMIKHLKSLDPEEASAEKMRRKIIGLAYSRAGLGTRASPEQKRVVVKYLDGWCVQYGHKHKKLDGYTYKELPKLVSQFEAVMDSLVINL
jgi:hypothetical protein